MTFPAWGALADLKGMSIGQQQGVVAALARIRPSLLVEIAGREDVPVDIRADLVRETPDFLLDRVMRALPWSDELFDAAVEQRGATRELVVLGAANGRRADAVELAGQLLPAEAAKVKYQWEREFGEPIPADLRSALVRAVLAHREPRHALSEMSNWEREETLEKLRVAGELRDSQIWELLEPEPQLWLEHAEDGEHGRTVQRVLLERADELPDAVLLACLPTVTGEELRRDNRNDLFAGIRLDQTASWVRRRPRVRELAAKHLERVVREAVEDGWRPEGSGSLGPRCEEIAALAELSTDSAQLVAAAAALGAAEPPNYLPADRERLVEWYSKRAHAVSGLAANHNLPRDAILAALPSLDEQALEMVLAHQDPVLEQPVQERLEQMRSAAAAREPVMVDVPDDEELEQFPAPADELRKHLRHLKGRAAQRDNTCAGLLRSRFVTADILRQLPAVLVLESDEQAGQVAQLVAQTCGEDVLRWRAVAELQDTPPGRKVTFGALLDTLAKSGSTAGRRRAPRGGREDDTNA